MAPFTPLTRLDLIIERLTHIANNRNGESGMTLRRDITELARLTVDLATELQVQAAKGQVGF